MKTFLKNSVGLMLFACVVNVAFAQNSSNEKVILTNSKPTISFCVASGDVKVRGWERDEVRVSIDGNGKIGAKIMERDDDKKASWLMILGYEPKENSANKQDECLRGGEISLDVPRGSSVGIKSKDGDLNVENVAKVTIKNINGEINLRDIANETEVTSLSSDISIENASGKIAAKSVSGNIGIYRCKPIEISDSCKVSSTSGNVLLQEATHRNIEATSTSGDVAIYGALSNGGSYDFSTTDGAINLFLPANSSFQLNATMSYGGSFNSEIPLKTSTQKTSQTEARHINATCGAGDSNINLTTFNGSLQIKKAK